MGNLGDFLLIKRALTDLEEPCDRNASSKTAVHEIGHVLDLGEADDRNGEEVYSGDGNDRTSEFVEDPSGDPIETWSVMSNGISDELFVDPTGVKYTAFSIEEWISINRGPLEI